jgi:hypothetical protein
VQRAVELLVAIGGVEPLDRFTKQRLQTGRV